MLAIFFLISDGIFDDGDGNGILEFGRPDDVDLSIELKDWLFALEGAEDMAEDWSYNGTDVSREERCWHTTFQSLQMKAKSPPKSIVNNTRNICRVQYPVELLIVSISFEFHCNNEYDNKFMILIS